MSPTRRDTPKLAAEAGVVVAPIAPTAAEAAPEGATLPPGAYRTMAFCFLSPEDGPPSEGYTCTDVTVTPDGAWRLRVSRIGGGEVLLDEAGRGPLPWARLGMALVAPAAAR